MPKETKICTTTLRVPERFQDVIDLRRARRSRNRSVELRDSAEAYYALYDQALFNIFQTFSQQEAFAVLDPLSGLNTRGVDARAWGNSKFAHEVSEGLAFRGCAKKHGVDVGALMSKINSLSFFERWVFADWASMMWGVKEKAPAAWEGELARFEG